MIEIDGSIGEGGGQVVRSAVALSNLWGEPVRVINIRKSREAPGLKAQHLHAIKALAELTNAEVSGLSIGSSELLFKPGSSIKSSVNVNIPTAGSIGLVLQCLIIALLKINKPVKIFFNGGATCGEWSPPLDYINNVWFFNMSLWGYSPPQVIVKREGYYPKGGAIVELIVKPSKLKSADFLEHKPAGVIKGISHASDLLKNPKVAERQAESAAKGLVDYNVKIESKYSKSLCPGSSITLWSEGLTRVGADSIGERGKSSELVGSEAALKLKKELDSKAAFDSHMADMLIPLLAIVGGSITVSEVTSHAKTNIWLCEHFTKKKFTVKGSTIIFK